MSRASNPTAHPVRQFLVDHRRWVIIAMLLSLHLGLLAQSGSEYQRIFLLIHFGFFLLWQPFVSTDREMTGLGLGMLLLLIVVALVTLSGWMLAMWVALLIGVMGGKVFTTEASRRGRFYLVAVLYLFTMLLVWTVPVSLLGVTALPEGLKTIVSLYLPMVMIAMVFLPFQPEERENIQVFDFFYSLIVFQLVVVLVLGGIAAMRLTGNEYFRSVLLMVIVFALALMMLAILWGGRAGFGGLRSYFSRYLMSVGMPFELWMRRIAELSEGEMSSGRFLQSAMDELAHVPWIVGGKWISPDGNAAFGQQTRHASTFTHHQLEVIFFTESEPSPALFLHARLLAQVVGEFYEGKRREQAMKQNAYMQAVHETGARLTHDIKNVLQSLFALTSATAAQDKGRKPEDERRRPTDYDEMLSRQLPRLTQRLQTTLDKLQNPAVSTTAKTMRARDWWKDTNQRHGSGDVVFHADGDMEALLPAALFDTVLENCLENARKKRDDVAQVTITLHAGTSPTLAIADNGAPIPATAMAELFHAPIARSRHGGLGIGLYQAHKQAEQMGYALTVAANMPGRVEFLLAKVESENGG